MNNLLIIGWYQIYEIEREQHQDELIKIRVEAKRQEQLRHAELLAKIEKGQCDD
jgi:RNA-binding protein YhbY